jgi:hypothetical protein
MKWTKKRIFILAIIVAPPALALFAWGMGQIVMRLWNWLLPPLFGLPEVTVWQGLGLLVLSRLLFGGFGGSGGGGQKYAMADRKRFRRGVCEAREMDKADS